MVAATADATHVPPIAPAMTAHTGGTALRPCWNNVLRFPQSAQLRVEVMLKPVLREAIPYASTNTARWLESLDGATLTLEQLSDDACRLRCETAAGTAEFVAAASSEAFYRLRGRVDAPGGMRTFELDDVVLQVGGSRDAYLAQWSGEALRHLARLRYHADGSPANVSVFRDALAARLAPAARALLPNPIELVRLTWMQGGDA
ncbi:MAG TPA: hypothetical protein VGD42_03370 [Lysobacter sp.]